ICCISELPHTHRELRIPKLERFQQREAKHQFLAQPATNSKNTEHLAAMMFQTPEQFFKNWTNKELDLHKILLA
ncbi:MAG: hypothetical protein K8I00_08130, partial [Candidatus Omnitrophica bacterium]|nr:hypothetical protein [Candidatus Omnitrophota bacterium]